MCGEFVGTVLFLYFALSGTQVANTINSSAGLTVQETGANPQQLQYIALSFGMSLAVNAWVFFRISGGLFNPAVTIGMCLIGALPWVRGALLFFVQILGGMVAAALVSCMFPGPLDCQTTLGGGTSVVRGLFIEMILTAQLIFTIFMLAAEKACLPTTTPYHRAHTNQCYSIKARSSHRSVLVYLSSLRK